jgi:hypothetical protein
VLSILAAVDTTMLFDYIPITSLVEGRRPEAFLMAERGAAPAVCLARRHREASGPRSTGTTTRARGARCTACASLWAQVRKRGPKPECEALLRRRTPPGRCAGRRLRVSNGTRHSGLACACRRAVRPSLHHSGAYRAVRTICRGRLRCESALARHPHMHGESCASTGGARMAPQRPCILRCACR